VPRLDGKSFKGRETLKRSLFGLVAITMLTAISLTAGSVAYRSSVDNPPGCYYPAGSPPYSDPGCNGAQHPFVGSPALYTVDFNDQIIPTSGLVNYSGGLLAQGFMFPDAANPIGNVTYYHVTTPASTVISPTGAPSQFSPVIIDLAQQIQYFGFEIGSADEYNVLEIWDTATNTCIDRIYALKLDTTTLPTQEYCTAGGTTQSANQVAPQFFTTLLAIYFNPGLNSEGGFAEWRASSVSERANRLVLSSTQRAFETDNHTFEFVPEPSTWAMMGGGLVLLGLVRRLR
jgi:hypothetical protein